MTATRWDPADPANQALDAQRDEAMAAVLARRAQPVRRALDLGCGKGEVLPTLGVSGVGIDRSLVRLRLAPVPVAQADGAALPFPAATFDVVALVNVVSSVPDEARRRALAAEVLRVLEPGGVVLWYDQRWPNPANRATRPVTRRDLAVLFPGADADLEPITLVPALARTFPRSAPRLHGLRFLRSHLVGALHPR